MNYIRYIFLERRYSNNEVLLIGLVSLVGVVIGTILGIWMVAR